MTKLINEEEYLKWEEAQRRELIYEPVAYFKKWEDKSGEHKDIKFSNSEGYKPLYTQPAPQTAQEPIDVVQIKKDAEQTLQDLKSMNAKFAKENGKPIHIHLWSLSGGLKFDLREPNPETMVMDFYLGSIEIKQATQLAFNIKELQYNKLTGVK